jgi:hypothetical protein
MSVKISQLSASSDITSDDFFPVVDSGSLTTKRASAQQMLDYVTGSTFDTLTVTTLDGTTAQFTTITGSTGIFTNLTASSFSASQPSVVDVNSTSAALRVTQRGTGQSIRVEDSTNPDSSPFVVDAAGLVGIATATPGALLDVAGNALSSTSSYTAEFKASSGTTNAGRTLFSQNSTYAFAMSPLVTSATNGRVEFQYIERSTGNLLATPLTLRGDGKVGVGTVGPSKSLHINNSGLLIDGTNTVESSSFAARMIVDSGVSTGHTLADFRNSNGSKLFVGGTNVGIGTSSPSAVLDVNGNTVISGNLNVTGSISAPTGTFTMLSGSSGNITISGSLSGMIAALTSSVADYILVAADSGKVVVLSSSSGITASIPTGLPVGFTTTIVQNGSGSIFVSASSGVVIRNRQNHTRTAGLYATVAIIGTGSNSYIFAGDTTS